MDPFASMPPTDLDNQTTYWNRVADQKTFTHPIDLDWLGQCVGKVAHIVDYGCGYGRTVRELLDAGYRNVVGYDTAMRMVMRGRRAGLDNLQWIASPAALPLGDGEADAILLFAVLTCIPSDEGQRSLLDLLWRKLRPGGVLYVSDYFLQADRILKGAYRGIDDPAEGPLGVFALAEGVTLRHLPGPWIEELFAPYGGAILVPLDVTTMNGNAASAFQAMLRKPTADLG